ncbi:hypothetical protein RAB80_000194 [Fusarium oxysporum f. sp. vasinfectum]|uniref:Uncharacterized protein n=1 Tax=Fusarium oxysporum f. sp. vasinfectum 25433 TaxID=1089449 RepID=X0M5U7_FUSOX|nr:hypothetical protein FOTG_05151 [Fusarium oxysporum f. sp. vasinfectum 25433]KAK2682248.1 hypothetical protein RAB80_000194 [Fusarium oxysporum f. sp. vasinfectum]
MSNHHIGGLTLSSSSEQMTSSRPQQEGKLALLPVEVLLNITGEPGKDKQAQILSHKDFKSLALSCGVFFRELRQAYYRADNFAAFHSALRCADVEAMERCYQLANPPLHLERKISCHCPADKPHKHHRPIDDVLECLAIGSVPIDRCIKATRWLLSKGCEANEQKDQVWYLNNRHYGHMSELLIDVLGNASDKSTNLANWLWGLFLDIADPSTVWKEAYQGEAADILESKIQVLAEYGAVDSNEVIALQSIVAALRDNPFNFELIDEGHDGKDYWEKLCNTLRPFSNDENLLRNHLLLGMNFRTELNRRLHSFIFEAEWNPWTVWHDYKMQCPKHRANLSHPWMTRCAWRLFQRSNGKWYDPEWVTCAEGSSPCQLHRGRPLPQWYQVNYSEFVAAVERPWLEKGIPGHESQLKDETTENSTASDSRSEERAIEAFRRRFEEILA